METRRDFIKKASLLTGALGIAGILPPSIQRAMAIDPKVGSTFLDAEHVVFLMQENRSFDHAFGTLKGVRGFNDPRAIALPNQYPVWLQSNKKGQTYAPFRLNIKDTKATWMSALPHSWENQVDARNNGKYDGWLEAKRSGNKEYADMPLTMGYYNREDIPFYYSLADAFTVCDHNFCSILTGTSPNRCFFWTGKIREEQNATSTAHHSNGYIDGSENVSWSTFPERLSKHNVDWKIYQNELSVGVGLENEEDDWLANFTDNDMEFFKQYHVKRHPEHLVYLRKAKTELEAKLKEKPDDKLKKKLDFVTKEIEFLEVNTLDKLTPEQQDLHKRAFVTNRNDPDFHNLETITYDDKGTQRTAQIPKGDVLHQFRKDVDGGKLPTVSWLVAPSNFSDHPGAPWYGAWYLSEAIDILTKNPEVWKKTIFILTYDENDGYFDHLPPFVSPDPKNPETGAVSKSLDNSSEYLYIGENSKRESSLGLGFRVPMVVVSPWSRGGYVNSQVFDHTSSIQFLEQFLSHKTGQKIYEDNISSWRRSLCGDLTSVFRPYNGENIPLPKAVERLPFLESIHKAKFAKLPNNFKNLDQLAIAGIIKNPKGNPNLPKQEPGIKPANAIPYELYAHGALDTANNQFKIGFTAGNKFFGDKAKGTGFIVYATDNNWNFTVDAGDTIDYNWPLHNGVYDLKVYSVNGFYRRYKGSANDPKIAVSLMYQSEKDGSRVNGNVLLHVKRITSGEQVSLTVKDNSYKKAPVKAVLKKNQEEIFIPLDLKSSHSWYDFTVTSEKHVGYSQQFAGHAEHSKESFTDPLMGHLV
ncbi:phospholipase C, phosphocholine-specific [Pedobacter panaciterrae]|uniref:phospholipase C n=1 Tax=Pedobacter panaciterrae TaxID=363849 RepID=A0ABU8NN09_9SPHI